MKKMYALTLCLIAATAILFLLFSSDTNQLNKSFLSDFGILISDKPVSFEEMTVPDEFDSVYREYNLMQLECGLDLSPYKGCTVVRYTYNILNLPKNIPSCLANVICHDGRPIAGDIINPALDGFIKPLNFFEAVSLKE